MIIYFTGTGNSRYIAKAISERLGDEVVSSNEYVKSETYGNFVSETPFIFVFPIYLSTIPEVFRKFVLGSKFAGSKEAYFIPTCAGTSGSAAVAAREMCEQLGLEYKGNFDIFMPQNYVALFTMYDQEKIKSTLETAEVKVDLVCEKIKNGASIESRTASGFEYGTTKLVEKLYNKGCAITTKFFAEDSCVSCGLCEKNCPVNAIEMQEGRPVWVKKTCIHCMGCINRCPVQAIQFGKGTKEKPRWICPER